MTAFSQVHSLSTLVPVLVSNYEQSCRAGRKQNLFTSHVALIEFMLRAYNIDSIQVS